MGADVIHIQGEGPGGAFVEALRSMPFTKVISAGNGLIQVGVDSGNRRLVDVVTAAGRTDFRIEDISVAKPSLGDVFLKYTGRQFRD
jgi:ABC-2 type transport system ATP-binding protein